MMQSVMNCTFCGVRKTILSKLFRGHCHLCLRSLPLLQSTEEKEVLRGAVRAIWDLRGLGHVLAEGPDLEKASDSDVEMDPWWPLIAEWLSTERPAVVELSAALLVVGLEPRLATRPHVTRVRNILKAIGKPAARAKFATTPQDQRRIDMALATLPPARREVLTVAELSALTGHQNTRRDRFLVARCLVWLGYRRSRARTPNGGRAWIYRKEAAAAP